MSETGELWFPARLTQEYLDDRKARMGPYMFAAQFMLEAIAPEDRRFEPDWIQYSDCFLMAAEGSVHIVTNLTGHSFPVFVTCAIDPALSSKKQGDFTGMVTVACDHYNNWYVLSARRIRGAAPELMNTLIEEIRRWHIGIVGIETVVYQTVLQEYLLDRFRNEGLMVGVKEFPTGSGRGKRARIEGLVPKFAAHQVYLRKGLGPELETELLQWSPDRDLRHDDLIDALSYHLELAGPPSLRGPSGLGADWFDLHPDDRAHRRGKRESLDYDIGRPHTGYGD